MIHVQVNTTKNRNSLTVHPFSLIELLVVTGVIAILAGMLMPALTKARAKAIESNMINSARQMHLALLMYYDSDESNQFIWNTVTSGGKIGVDFTELETHGFLPRMMEDPFRTVPIAEDPFLTQESPVLNLDATSFYSTGTGLLYFNLISTDSSGNPIMSLADIKAKFGYNLPDDTQYVLIGVGMDGKLDYGKPINDFVYIKREDNSNHERFPDR